MISGWRNALAALGVLAALGALVAVPALVDAQLPGEAPVPSAARLEVGYGVALRPPAGARLAVGPSRPGSGEVELRVGGLVVGLKAVEVRGPAAEFAAHVRYKFSRDQSLRAGPPEAVSTAAGVAGEQGALVPERGGERPGCYAVFVARSAGVVVTITPVDGCAAVPGDVETAVRSITFGSSGG